MICIKILNSSEEKESFEKVHVRVITQVSDWVSVILKYQIMRIMKKDEEIENQLAFLENDNIIIVEKYNKLL